MNRQANVHSIDSLRRFRAAICEYADSIQDILAQLLVESNRTIDWVQHDRMTYWPAEIRKSRDAVNEALNTLQIKQLTIDGGPKPSCVEERNNVQKVKRRLRHSEQQVQALRQLLPSLQHEADEYQGVLGKLSQLLETDLPAATAALDRMISALTRYASLKGPLNEPAPDLSKLLDVLSAQKDKGLRIPKTEEDASS